MQEATPTIRRRTAMKEAVPRTPFIGMVHKRAKTPRETGALMVELEGQQILWKDSKGHLIEEAQYKSVIEGKKGLEKFNRTVMAFVNLVMSGDGIGGYSMAPPQIEGAYEDEWHEGDEVYELVEVCHKCRDVGRYANSCPSKGQGK